jgi:hypothetical protein
MEIAGYFFPFLISGKKLKGILGRKELTSFWNFVFGEVTMLLLNCSW